MRRRTVFAVLCWLGVTLPGHQLIAQDESNDRRRLQLEFADEIQPLLTQYCFDCHSGATGQGQLDLKGIRKLSYTALELADWKRVWDILQAREMPPIGESQPTAAERARLNAWLIGVLVSTEPGRGPDPGHVFTRRLNGVEYNNTLFDLFGFNKPTTYFDPQRGMPEQVRLVPHRDYRPILVDLPPDDVDYGFDNIGEILTLPPFLMEKYLTAARQVVALAMNQEPRKRGDVSYRSTLFGRFQTADPEGSRASAQAFLADFTERAFRQPVSDSEVERYLRLFDAARQAGAPFAQALAASIQAVLISPKFLFRVELGDAAREEQGIRPLTDYELASRLSYFLWSSMPDEELFRLAAAGELRKPEVLESQARRMLHFRKAKQLAENFALQWLQVRDIQGAMPDPDLFPEFYKRSLPHALRQEALLLFETTLVEDSSVLTLIDPDYTWLNGTLAGFYGINPDLMNERNSSLYWHRYPLTDKRRGGVLTMGATLLITSASTRTSPVKRGKWLLETILGSPPPPPLENVPDLVDTPAAEDGLALREKLQRHRSDPQCATCHRRMDPLGLGLENFDAIGAWRDREGPLPIEASGTLTDGNQFTGPVELKELIIDSRRDDFLRCLTEHMLTYALGRKLEPYDLRTVHEIVDRMVEDEYRLSRLVVEIVKSYPFTHLKIEEDSNE